ncbi:glycerate kinase family protein [Virgibacillus siamensis]|uniref:glycerate kinase family protein n=1 Tax=Virgibacillus siamensis TaxID=480071 RepID=UPI000984B34F|nr:glycerate kinase [Virgibacillus siamensis]
MKVAMIPSGFKECLSAEEVAAAMKNGAKRFDPFIKTEKVPMVDGGEGFAKTITRIKQGELIHKKVTGPVGEQVDSHYGIFGENNIQTAVIEMAAVAGLKMVPSNQRNPLKTTTYGVGELIIDALEKGADYIIIGCGDSGTSDGGAGMAQALGVRFLDENHRSIYINGGEDLYRAAAIDTTDLDVRLQQTKIEVACNWTNVLCGKKGVANVFGPQKGATPEQVKVLSVSLERYADLIKYHLGIDVRQMPGGGASGGLGAGLYAFANAQLHPRFELIMDFIQIEEKIAQADLVITAEGSLDFQSVNGKIPSEVARVAQQYNTPVVAITGTVGLDAELNYNAGIHAYSSIIQKPVTLEQAMFQAPKWIEESVEGILRHITIGLRMSQQRERVFTNGDKAGQV